MNTKKLFWPFVMALLVSSILGAGWRLRHRLKALLPERTPVACVPPTSLASGSRPLMAYSTSFPLAESVISEGGAWANGGRRVGLDWSDIRTISGLAFGLQSGTGQGRAHYDDSMAFLSGTWGPDQTVSATVHSVNQDDRVYEEVELLLRGTMTARCVTAYEINFRCSKTANAYSEVVRWNGPLGDFTYIARGKGSEFGVADGDTVEAAIVGNVITVRLNGKQILRAEDRTYVAGNPGMGFFLEGTGRPHGSCGFSRYSASADRADSAPDASEPTLK